MVQNSRLGGPEIVGLGIVGATVGAVICGETLSASGLMLVAGALAGAWILPALFVARKAHEDQHSQGRLLNEIV